MRSTSTCKPMRGGSSPVAAALIDQRVSIQGIKSRLQLNGAFGHVLHFNKEKDRFEVRLEDGGELLLLKADNLWLVSGGNKKSSHPTKSLPSDTVIDLTGAQISQTAADLGGEGPDGLYRWGQTRDAVVLQTLLPAGITSRDVVFKPTRTSVMLSVYGETLVDGSTYAGIVPDESTFVLENEADEDGRRLTLHLKKRVPTGGVITGVVSWLATQR